SGPSALAGKRRYGAVVSYRLNLAASVRVTVQQTLPGRTVGKGKHARCVAPTSRNRRARGCRRTLTLRGNFLRAGRAGANHFRFTGRIGGRKLKRGSYTLVLTPSVSGRAGRSAISGFRVLG
ncbi:MAG: hypothetical protein ACXVRN_12515, partial [Solirubrobacteraceae bacterium]